MLLRLLACASLALSLSAPAMAEVRETTSLDLFNNTGTYVWIDAYMHHGKLEHIGMVPPGHMKQVRLSHVDMRFFTDIHVYVKKYNNDDPAYTVCTAMKTFGNTTGKPAIVESIFYDRQTEKCGFRA